MDGDSLSMLVLRPTALEHLFFFFFFPPKYNGIDSPCRRDSDFEVLCFALRIVDKMWCRRWRKERGDGSAWLLQKKGVKPSRGRIEL